MKKIVYYAPNDTMGETSGDDCEKFREWAERELNYEFPDYEILVTSEDSTVQCWTNDFENEERISEFVHTLWDNCPWDWD